MRSSVGFAFEKPETGVRAFVVNTYPERSILGSDRRTSSAVSDSGIACSRRFLLRAAGNVQTPWSMSTSRHSIWATSSRRAPVKISKRNDRSERPADRLGRLPHEPEFVIAQDALARPALLACWRLNTLKRIFSDDPALDRPAAQDFELCEHAVRGDWRAAIRDLIEEIVNLRRRNRGKSAALPFLYGVLFEEAFGLAPIASLSLRIPLDEFLDDLLDKISLTLALGLSRGSIGRLLPCRVFPLAILPRASSAALRRRFEVKRGEASEREFARNAAGSIS